MVDKVVRYHYPKCVHTNYQREHRGYNTVKKVGGSTKFEPFNVEKEHKIINPHNVEHVSQNQLTYKGYKVAPKEKRPREMPKATGEFPVGTTNQEMMKNWGPNEIIHEKSPQYPYYSLPFAGESTNNKTYHNHSNENTKSANGIGLAQPGQHLLAASNFYKTVSGFGNSQGSQYGGGSQNGAERTYETTN